MTTISGFRTHQFIVAVRFVQGYRYLDLCGEALVLLENSLGAGWIPGEASPKAGHLRNVDQGIVAQFNAELVQVTQTDFHNLAVFRDACLRITETLCHVFRVERINAPTFRQIVQKGFATQQDAETDLLARGFTCPHPVLAGKIGPLKTMDYTYVSEVDDEWCELPVHLRRRLNISIVRQLRQPPFDQRIMSRVRLLPQGQKEAMQAIMRLRKDLPDIPEHALQLDLEHTFETEFPEKVFDLARYLQVSSDWASDAIKGLAELREHK